LKISAPYPRFEELRCIRVLFEIDKPIRGIEIGEVGDCILEIQLDYFRKGNGEVSMMRE
jgi:hypothetical protein